MKQILFFLLLVLLPETFAIGISPPQLNVTPGSSAQFFIYNTKPVPVEFTIIPDSSAVKLSGTETTELKPYERIAVQFSINPTEEETFTITITEKRENAQQIQEAAILKGYIKQKIQIDHQEEIERDEEQKESSTITMSIITISSLALVAGSAYVISLL